MIKECEHCGKVFYTRKKTKKYCSKRCKSESLQLQREKDGQLCWRCNNACGGCLWSKKLKPIKGWTAVPVTIKDSMGDISTYKITDCPQFEVLKW